MFDILGIDWGEKRFGLAFGDTQNGLIIPFSREAKSEEIWKILQTEIKNRAIKTVILGKPTNFKGGETEITQKIQKFSEELKTNFPELKVKFQNERGTSQTAKQKGIKNKTSINHQSAVEILNLFLKN
jgi:putative transcription antitermination factor YqgF